uniref:Uncharacterized protein n=1 Tax=Rhizophora mucronata TaxID=61149 RepID=A0A2P2QQV1_RHIMU
MIMGFVSSLERLSRLVLYNSISYNLGLLYSLNMLSALCLAL